MNKMNTAEMLVEFIKLYMNSYLSERDFEDSILDVKRPDAIQTKALYVEALGIAVGNNDTVHEILNTIICSDDDVQRSILNAGVDKPKLKKCLEILFTHSKGSKSETQG